MALGVPAVVLLGLLLVLLAPVPAAGSSLLLLGLLPLRPCCCWRLLERAVAALPLVAADPFDCVGDSSDAVGPPPPPLKRKLSESTVLVMSWRMPPAPAGRGEPRIEAPRPRPPPEAPISGRRGAERTSETPAPPTAAEVVGSPVTDFALVCKGPPGVPMPPPSGLLLLLLLLWPPPPPRRRIGEAGIDADA